MADPRTGEARLDAARETVRVDKPWGYELLWAYTKHYAGKILHVEAGRRLSLQYHDRKDETLYVLTGRVEMELESADGRMVRSLLGPGEAIHVAPGRRHRMTAIETSDVLEVSTPELDDVIRVQDDFGRAG